MRVPSSSDVDLQLHDLGGTGPALLIRGRLETAEGVVNVIAEKISLLPLSTTIASRDFR